MVAGSGVERDDLGYLLARASQTWDTRLAERCRAYGFPEVKPAFGALLLPLFGEDGLRMGTLADRARLSKQTITGLVAEAETAGLVERRPDADDGRAVRVCLTRRAEEFRPVAQRILTEMHDLLAGQLSEQAIAGLARALEAVRAIPPLNPGMPRGDVS